MAQELRRRDLLHLRHLEEFAAFCELRGWIRCQTKGDYEVLRMKGTRLGGKVEWLIVHKRDHNLNGTSNVVHATTWGNSTKFAQQFYRQRKGVK